MRRYVIYVALVLSALVIILNLFAPLVVFGSTRLTRQPSLTIYSVGAAVSPDTISSPAVLEPDAARGQAIFRTYCSGCHAAEAKFGTALGSVEFKADYPDDEAIKAVVRNGRAPMPSFPDHTLDDTDLADLVVYIRTLK